MSIHHGVALNVDGLRLRATLARQRAGEAQTTQMRQHLEGMADFWEELLQERLTANASPSA
jgi:hypothetical protein